MKINLILNPVAGRGKSLKVLPRIKKFLDRKHPNYEVFRTQYPGNGIELARDHEDPGAVTVSVGGDGTAREVLNGIQSPNSPIGIIPAGMGNDFARSLGIPTDPEEAIRCILDGQTLEVDLGSSQGKLFNVMGVGFPAEVMKTIESYKNGFVDGSVIYLLGLLRSVTRLNSYDLRLELDGKKVTLEANAVFVVNSNYTAGGIKLVPQARLTDGLLDVAVISDAGRIELILALKQAYRGTHVNHPKIDFYRARSVNIDSETRLPLMFDGELEGTTPTRLEIAPKARNLIVPSGNPAELKQGQATE